MLTAYQFLFPTAPRPSVAGRRAERRSVRRRAAAALTEPPGIVSGDEAKPAATPVAQVADERERRVEVQGDEVAVAFTNRGARLVSWQLKRYRDAKGRRRRWSRTCPAGRARWTSRPETRTSIARLRDALFQPSSEVVTLAGTGETELALPLGRRGHRGREEPAFPAPGYLVRVAVG